MSRKRPKPTLQCVGCGGYFKVARRRLLNDRVFTCSGCRVGRKFVTGRKGIIMSLSSSSKKLKRLAAK